jgi:hypothetical protein
MHKFKYQTTRRSTKIAGAIAALSLLLTLYPTGVQAADAPGVEFNLSVAGTLLRDGSTVN